MGVEINRAAPHLVVSGEIDLAVAPSLREAGAELARTVAPGRLEVDLGDVTFIDSSGLGALISVRNAARQSGADLVLVRVTPTVTRFFELAGVIDTFKFE